MQEDKVNILLVDDQPGKLMAHEAILLELGENIVKARNGREALECLLKEDFAVILLDVNMPGMDGFETAELIRQRPRFEKTPIIFITAYNTSDIDRLKGYRLGAVDYMFLPVIAEVLKAKVSVFVELARQTQIIKKQAERLAFHNEEQARKLEVIQQLNAELREANEQLETFSYSVSHDLRAPLRSLQGFSEVLLEDYTDKLDEEGRTYLERIKAATIQMEQLTRDLLQYCRLTREDMTPQPVAVETLLKDVLSMHNFTLPAHGQLILREGMHRVMANPTLLGQCLSNLINNAFKFATPDVPPCVEVWTEREGHNRVRINVMDNGIGIDPAHHEKVFGLFERVGNVKEHDGTGIGLAIVARAVQRMGGQCGVDSQLGTGSRFWIQLPAAH